jgi:hypothetical protein
MCTCAAGIPLNPCGMPLSPSQQGWRQSGRKERVKRGGGSAALQHGSETCVGTENSVVSSRLLRHTKWTKVSGVRICTPVADACIQQQERQVFFL